MHFQVLGEKIALQAFDGVCYSNNPGHAVHPVQFRVGSREQRQPVMVFQNGFGLKLIGEDQSWLVYNHNEQVITNQLILHPKSKVELAPLSSLLFIRPNEEMGFVYYVAESPVSACQESLTWKNKESGSWL
jgi:hypothetical protein